MLQYRPPNQQVTSYVTNIYWSKDFSQVAMICKSPVAVSNWERFFGGENLSVVADEVQGKGGREENM